MAITLYVRVPEVEARLDSLIAKFDKFTGEIMGAFAGIDALLTQEAATNDKIATAVGVVGQEISDLKKEIVDAGGGLTADQAAGVATRLGAIADASAKIQSAVEGLEPAAPAAPTS